MVSQTLTFFCSSLSENLLLSFSQGIKQILFIHLTSDCKNKILGPDNSIRYKKSDPNQHIISVVCPDKNLDILSQIFSL